MTGTIDLDEVVERLAARDLPRTEADVQADVRTLLLYGDLNLTDPQVRLEAPVPGRLRIDVEVGSAVIEVKKNLSLGNVREEARVQLEGYVRQRTAALDRRYVGLLTDGLEWSLYTLGLSGLELVDTFMAGRGQSRALRHWLEVVLATTERIRPTPDEIEAGLGASSPSLLLDLASLRALYASSATEPEVRMKRELWARLLATALGTHFTDDDDLFINHTYLVIVAEAIAHAAAGFNIADPRLSPSDLVSGQRFHAEGIGGVVEPDFFDWPVETPDGSRFVRDLARRLARFDWAAVEHDVLKALYESVIDADTRKRLGEYYTPDWLAQHIVDTAVDDPLNQRVLDPACGSGTFLFWAVRNYMAAAEAAGVPNAQAIAGVTRHVFGVDLHPVAVTLARVTYLLAIGTERLQERDAFSVPVYLGDAIQWSQDTSVLAADGIRVSTSDGLEMFAQELRFPESVVADAGGFDRLVSELADLAARRRPGSPQPNIDGILRRHGVVPLDRPAVQEAFGVLCHLHDVGRDHIWGYYIRNLARPLEFTRSANQVDRLVGNPPWLASRFMNQDMRDRFSDMSHERGIRSGHHAQRDLAGLFVARAVELYLRRGGKFAFVMPYAALSRGQYTGFRSGKWSSRTAQTLVRHDQPLDLTRVQPDIFPVPACVVRGEKADAFAEMPSEAITYAGRVPNHRVDWSVAGPLLSVGSGEVALASLDFVSPYGRVFRTGAPLYPRMLMMVEDAPPSPLGTPAGQRRVISRRTPQEKDPWKSLESMSGAVERQFIKPVHLGETVLPFRTLAPAEVIVPWVRDQLVDAASTAMQEYPGLAAWWSNAEQLWDANAPDTNRLSLNEKIDYVHALQSQFPRAAHRVVYTKAGRSLVAARLEDKTLVENGLYWAPAVDEREARYLCAVLNSLEIRQLVVRYQAVGLLGPRHFDKYIWLLDIPEFDATDLLHTNLVEVAERAEAEAATVDVSGLGFQSARRKVRAALERAGLVDEIEAGVRRLMSGRGISAGPVGDVSAEADGVDDVPGEER